MRRCFDTTFLSDILRGKADALDASERWALAGDRMLTTTVNWYEVGLGIARIQDERVRRRFVRRWDRLSRSIQCVGLSRLSADVAAARQAELTGKGRPAPLADLLIASIAFANDCEVIISRDTSDFARIALTRVERH